MSHTMLVTGATGTVGSEVVKALSNRGLTVRAGVHSTIKGDRLKRLDSEVQLVEMDFNKPETLHTALTGVDRVFMITPFTQDQVAEAKQLIDAARGAGVQQVVRMSAAGAESEPGIQLGRWHREIEKYLEQSGLTYTILRPTSFMQNFINFNADSIRHDGKVFSPVGEGKVSYIDVRDIAAVGAAILTGDVATHAGKAYTLTGPEAIGIQKVADAIGHETGRPVTYVPVSEEAAREAMGGAPAWMVDALMELNSISKAGYAAQVTPDVEQLAGRPACSIEKFAKDNRHHFTISTL